MCLLPTQPPPARQPPMQYVRFRGYTRKKSSKLIMFVSFGSILMKLTAPQYPDIDTSPLELLPKLEFGLFAGWRVLDDFLGGNIFVDRPTCFNTAWSIARADDTCIFNFRNASVLWSRSLSSSALMQSRRMGSSYAARRVKTLPHCACAVPQIFVTISLSFPGSPSP